MAILLFPTRRDLETEVVKGPVVIVEQFVQSDGQLKFFCSIYANHITLDRREHATLNEAINTACERNRDGVRVKKPASFNPVDPSVTALDMGVSLPTTPPPASEEGEDHPRAVGEDMDGRRG